MESLYLELTLLELGHKSIYNFENGKTYEGHWIDNKKNGEGILTLPNGNKYKIEYSNNTMTKQEKYVTTPVSNPLQTIHEEDEDED